MSDVLHKKSILKKMTQVGGSTLVSRALALFRTAFEIQYLGVGAVADAFWAAYRIPTTLRRVFAEGALSAAFIPSLVKISKEEGESQASKLMTLMLLIIEAIVLVLCVLIFYYADSVLLFVAPGFKFKPVELATAIPLLRLLIFFVLFVSSSALLAGAMQAKHHFFIPSWGPALLNIFFITGLALGIKYNLPVSYLSFFLLAGGVVLLMLHIHTYFKLGFSFITPDKKTWNHFKSVMFKFLPCVFTMSAMEINLTIDSMLASYLPTGSIAIFTYSSGFFRIPVGVFAAAFSTILLSHFSRVSTYAPKRLNYYLLESTKFVFWVTIPVALLMTFFSSKFFNVLAYYSGQLTVDQVNEASMVLKALLVSLFFVSINKVLLSIYYSLHSTFLPTLIALGGTVLNTSLNFLLVPHFGTVGLAVATSAGEILKTFLFIYILHKKFDFTLYLSNLFGFFGKFIVQMILIGATFYGIYKSLLYYFGTLTLSYSEFFINGLGYWIWCGALSLIFFLVLYIFRKRFGIKVYFLD